MARTLYAYDPAFRAPRGGSIIDIQKGLAQAGASALSIDGVFGLQSVTALKAWQSRTGQPATPAVDETAWQTLTGTPTPLLFRRCLALTAAYEGQGYTLAVGNFDGAGVTWGIVGFTLLTGDLAKVIRLIDAQVPAVLANAFGANLPVLMEKLAAPKAEQTLWANTITLNHKTGQLLANWQDAFEALGNDATVRIIQDQVSHDDYWRIAASDLRQYGKMTERDAAIFFDTAVQSGGVGSKRQAAVEAAIAALPAGADDVTRLSAIAKALTVGVNPTYAKDVLDRRLTIATGTGNVHQASYKISNWAIDLLPIMENDLA